MSRKTDSESRLVLWLAEVILELSRDAVDPCTHAGHVSDHGTQDQLVLEQRVVGGAQEEGTSDEQIGDRHLGTEQVFPTILYEKAVQFGKEGREVSDDVVGEVGVLGLVCLPHGHQPVSLLGNVLGLSPLDKGVDSVGQQWVAVSWVQISGAE